MAIISKATNIALRTGKEKVKEVKEREHGHADSFTCTAQTSDWQSTELDFYLEVLLA